MLPYIISSIPNLSIKVEVPNNNVAYRLFGRSNYGPYPHEISASEAILNFDEFSPVSDTVGVKTGNKFLPHVRTSSSVKDIILTGHNKLLSKDILSPIHPQYCFAQDNNFDDYLNLKFKLHCYEAGGVFAKHTDGKKSIRHFATLLIFPPSTYSPFTGGDLILYPKNNPPVVIEPSTFSNWTVVAFHLDIPHECTPITNGKRFVFKTELELPCHNIFFTNTHPTTSVVENSVNVSSYERKIQQAQEKIRKYQRKISDITANIPTSKILNYLEQIEKIPNNVSLILSNNNPSTDTATLQGEEALLWNHIISKWPYSTLQIKEIPECKCNGIGSYEYLGIEYDPSELGNSHILYWKSPKTHPIGVINDNYSEYNDETYDLYNDITVALICVQKTTL